MRFASESRLIGEAQLEVADEEGVSFINALVVDAHTFVFDAVCRPEIFNIVDPVATEYYGVLAGDVAIFDGQVSGLAASSDHKLVFVDEDALALK